MHRLLRPTSRLFDALHVRWESAGARHRIGSVLVATFLLTLAAIDANRRGLLPASLGDLIPTNHFAAVDLAFTLLLLVEVIALVFSLAQSVSNSVGKQFEIFSLILLRQSFKGFSHIPEPLIWDTVRSQILHMLSDAGGALAVFVLLGLYYKLQRHRPITDDSEDRVSFVAAKKLIALLLVLTFVFEGLRISWLTLSGGPSYPFFETFYTLLIFSDILIVLISLRYSSTYPVVFRNSGFAVTTVFIRLALTAPAYINALLGIAAGGFAIALTLSYNAFKPLDSAHGR